MSLGERPGRILSCALHDDGTSGKGRTVVYYTYDNYTKTSSSPYSLAGIQSDLERCIRVIIEAADK